MKKLCSSSQEMKKQWGSKNAKKIAQRLMELLAAQTLKDISHLPPARCHELGGNRAGQLSVDIEHPYRMVFTPDHDPIPTRMDGGLDWEGVTKILIIEIVDTHQ
jgi:proteic killer suppression protein